MKKTEDIIKEIGVPIYVRLLKYQIFLVCKAKNMIIINISLFLELQKIRKFYTLV